MRVQLLRVRGAGTRDFLMSKFTARFDDISVSNTSTCSSVVKDACLLTPRGRLVDTVRIASLLPSDEAFVLTSTHCVDDDDDDPGITHNYNLFQKLDRLIFPMDQVQLSDCGSSYKIMDIMASSKEKVDVILHKAMDIVQPGASNVKMADEKYKSFSNGVMIFRGTQFNFSSHKNSFYGYTIFVPDDFSGLERQLLYELSRGDGSDASNYESPPLVISAAEYDSLRIEYGVPSVGFEMTGDDDDGLKVGPLELNLVDAVDFEKGCYLVSFKLIDFNVN